MCNNKSPYCVFFENSLLFFRVILYLVFSFNILNQALTNNGKLLNNETRETLFQLYFSIFGLKNRP